MNDLSSLHKKNVTCVNHFKGINMIKTCIYIIYLWGKIVSSSAGGSGKFISLDFQKVDTECSYDYIFIYDGNSYNSPLLGSFSGFTTPDIVLARSGYVSYSLI